MAVYTSEELATMRMDLAKMGTGTHVKADVNAAFQNVEDVMVGQGKTAIFNAIGPGFTNAEKTNIFITWVKRRFGQDRGN